MHFLSFLGCFFATSLLQGAQSSFQKECQILTASANPSLAKKKKTISALFSVAEVHSCQELDQYLQKVRYLDLSSQGLEDLTADSTQFMSYIVVSFIRMLSLILEYNSCA